MNGKTNGAVNGDHLINDDINIKKRQRIYEAMRTFVRDIEQRTDESYSREFNDIRDEQETFRNSGNFPCSIGSQRSNSSKNRFRDILPYDSTRVILNGIYDDNHIPTEDEEDPYINASNIIGAEGSIAYIASQGPVPSTVDDFWKMIVQYNIEQIVMLCNLIEHDKPKCEKYWPDAGETMTYANANITLLSEEKPHEEYIVRSLNLEHVDASGASIIRVIRQFHYIQWPDHGCPETVDPLLDMLDLMHSFERPLHPSNILVHCSAGCGRTGTIIALDIVKTHLKLDSLPEDFKVYDFVIKLRKQRASMVQSRDQYEFLHRALAALFKRQINKLEEHDYINVPPFRRLPNGAVDGPSHGTVEKRRSQPPPFQLPASHPPVSQRPASQPPPPSSPQTPVRQDQNMEQKRRSLSPENRNPLLQNFAVVDNKPVPDYPHEPTTKPKGPEAMPWPDVIDQTAV